ncbi:hypothetical protein DAPPUDRAFT_106607 [Daphnia pulex]|uniref:Uncharacterized protein n=1 Tax=Daphnia pulex TaxID=6669 RepID=E9GU93_DAPPU|nr:hypothetical protein DAPPUDRAFT_106607 [Daphnia pulex]|eukprot:EFX76996.1 hypothetical protein DAPPUDRAFT_106607 [Daphnia pulex]
MTKSSAFVGLSICLFLVMGSLSQEASTNNQESLDSENELKRMLVFVRPLMGILRSDPRIKRSTDVLEAGWLSSSSRALPKKERDGGGYGYGGGDSYGYDSCCNEGHDYLGLISLISLGLLFLFLIQLLSTTTAAAGRKRRSNDLLSLEELLSQEDIEKVVRYQNRPDLRSRSTTEIFNAEKKPKRREKTVAVNRL